MKKYCLIFCILGMLSQAYAQTMISSSQQQRIVVETRMDSLLQYIDDGTLVIFDFDETLSTPKFKFPRMKWFCAKADRLVERGIDPHEARSMVIDIVSCFPEEERMEMELVEGETTKVIFDRIRDMEVKMMILTARPFVASVGTLSQLESMGISFGDKNIYAGELPFEDNIGFSENVFFSNQRPKGEMLFRFLDRIDFTPEKVVFVDDNYDECKSVYDALFERNIPGVCVNYTKIKNVEEELPFDFSRADRRLRQEFTQRRYDIAIYDKAS